MQVMLLLNGFNYCYLTLIILFDINHFFAHSEVVTSIAIKHFSLICKSQMVPSIAMYSSSSSSYRAGSTDIPDPLSPLLPIVHRPR